MSASVLLNSVARVSLAAMGRYFSTAPPIFVAYWRALIRSEALQAVSNLSRFGPRSSLNRPSTSFPPALVCFAFNVVHSSWALPGEMVIPAPLPLDGPQASKTDRGG